MRSNEQLDSKDKDINKYELMPIWHLDILNKIEKDIQEGKVKFKKLEDVKRELIALYMTI